MFKTLLIAFMVWANVASGQTVVLNGQEFTSNKVSRIEGVINSKSAMAFILGMMQTMNTPGPRLIIINSYGGLVDEGNKIIEAIEREKLMGTEQVCVVTKEADSMAFNILSHCDRRYAVPKATFVVHKIRTWFLSPAPVTEKILRQLADDLHKSDEPFRQKNSKEMHLTVRQYDKAADAERQWTAKELLKMHYLNGYMNE